MKLSVKVEYACRVLAQLARHYEREELSHIEGLAEREKVPANYLAQILAELRNGGLITSRRGKFGGYALARRPEAITLYDIVKVVDGDMLEMNLNGEGEAGASVARAWGEIQQVMSDKMRNTTLQSLMAEEEGMYYI